VISQDDEAEPRPKAAAKQMRKHEDAAEDTLEERDARAERGADDGDEDAARALTVDTLE